MNVQGSVERKPIAGEVFLRALAEHGVDYFFCNPGTDFPPIVEGFSRARGRNVKLPRPILVPHENLAVAMAHGAYTQTGRAQAVMVHVNVGTGNTINNLINLARDRVPLILAAGRTPVTEKGQFGSRSRQIHWGQEMFDQAGMVREIVKWDYELRMPGQTADVVARAHEMAMTTPRGPVYLVLPREPLSASLDRRARDHAAPRAAARASRSGGDRGAGGLDRERRAAADHHGGAGHRRRRGRGARQGRGARRHSGGLAQCALGGAAVVAPDECRLRLRPAGRRRRPDHRDRERRAVVSARRRAGARLPRRASRRGPDVRALSDALVPERSRDRGARVHHARGARCGAGQDEAQRGGAPREADRAPSGARARRPRRKRKPRRSTPRRSAPRSARPSAPTRSSSTNIR